MGSIRFNMTDVDSYLPLRWVALYASVIYLTLSWVVVVYDSLEGLPGGVVLDHIAPAIVTILILLGAIKGLKKGVTHRPIVAATLVGLLVTYLTSIYKVCLVPVERLHFVEYGVLAFLISKAMRGRVTGLRFYAYSAAWVHLVSFVDEVLQGVLPTRYFDERDIMVNAASGVLALIWIRVMSHVNHSARTDSDEGEGGFARSRPRIGKGTGRPLVDALYGIAVALTLVAVSVIARPPVRAEDMVGEWFRKELCGDVKLEFVLPESLMWEDYTGNWARAWFKVAGNRLDGSILSLGCFRSENTSGCGWRKGFKAQVYFTFSQDRFYFREDTRHPFTRERPKGWLGDL